MNCKYVFAFLVITGGLKAADDSTLEKETAEILEELFLKGQIGSDEDKAVQFRFLDLESLLEESSDLAAAYYKLSDEGKEKLLGLLEALNEILSNALHATSVPQINEIS